MPTVGFVGKGVVRGCDEVDVGTLIIGVVVGAILAPWSYIGLPL
jgi:hypothetical protein